MIRETILTTMNAEGRLHITPIGIIADGDGWIIAPFRPSTTLDNLRASAVCGGQPYRRRSHLRRLSDWTA
jgi:hypothetical protein